MSGPARRPLCIMEILIKDIKNHPGETVTVRGWLYNRRKSGKVQFLIIRDGTLPLQAVAFAPDLDKASEEALGELTQESSLEATGVVKLDERAPGGVELQVKEINLIQKAEPYPIAPKEHGPDFLLDHRHLWIRSPRQAALLRLRSRLIAAAEFYLQDLGYVRFDAPILTPAACEGTTTLFEADYLYDQTAYLTQSGQLYAEAGAMALGRVYTLGPTFRAEKSKTRRHLTEFWMLEPEAAFFGLDDIASLAEGLICHLVTTALEHCRQELDALEKDTEGLEKIAPPFPRITYREAMDILGEEGSETAFGSDLGGEDETILSGRFERPVIVTRYPAGIKAFYMKRDPDDPDLALCMDILAPEGYGEIVGGSVREDDFPTLLQRIEEHGLPRDSFEWYLDLRRYGSVPHAGFGLGIERTVCWIAGVRHVREAIPFPRLIHRLYP